MRLSIVTPSYNQGHFIQQTLDSVLTQEGNFELEYIVMDGGSTDKTVEILKRYKKRVNNGEFDTPTKHTVFRWQSKKDKGQSNAINQGWQQATGEVIAYINSDDYYEPGALRAVVRYFMSNPQAKWAYGGWNYVAANGEIRKTMQHEVFSKPALLTTCTICQPSCFMKADLFRELGPIDENLHLAMDYDLWLRFAEQYEPGVIHKVLSNARYYSEAKSSAQKKKQAKEVYNLAKKYSRPFSWLRLMQFQYYLRNLVGYHLKIEQKKFKV